MAEGKPDYYKFPRELYEAAKELPGAQGARLCLAALALFFDGEEPQGLSVRGGAVMTGFKGRIKKARSNFEATTERTPNERQTDFKRASNERQTDFKREAQNGALPAETDKAPAQVVPTDKRYRDKREEKPPPIPEGKPYLKEGKGDFISRYFGKTWRT